MATFCLYLMTDVDNLSCCITPELLSTMTSQERCEDVGRRRRAAMHGTETACGVSPTVNRRYAIRYPAAAADQRSAGTGSSCTERHVTPRNDDVTRQTEIKVGGGMTTVHRRRRRTAFTNDQV